MAIKLPEKNYFTVPELMRRWECNEGDIRHLVANGDLKPSYVINDVASVVTFVEAKDDAGLYWETCSPKRYVEDDEEGSTILDDDPTEFTDGFYYLLFPEQSGADDCRFIYFSKSRSVEKGPDTTCFMLRPRRTNPNTISMADIVKNGAFFFDEVVDFEARNNGGSKPEITEKPLGTVERENMLKLIVCMAIEGYKYKPFAARNESTNEIVSDLKARGIPLGSDTVLKYLKQGAELIPTDKRKDLK